MRERVYHSLTHQSLEERTSIHAETEEDTIYQIDRDVESIILPELNRYADELEGVILIAEGIGEENAVALPQGCDPREAAWRILMDPIDGTRGIMYDKRSAFFLAGAAPNKGESTSLRDVAASVMVELPTSRSRLSDEIWAIRGRGAHRTTYHLTLGDIEARNITP
ncbi:MAG: inositol monophosphatase family protein, partial [Candidatus Hinthialibacter sp.]